jgi:hypothetical protein
LDQPAADASDSRPHAQSPLVDVILFLQSRSARVPLPPVQPPVRQDCTRGPNLSTGSSTDDAIGSIRTSTLIEVGGVAVPVVVRVWTERRYWPAAIGLVVVGASALLAGQTTALGIAATMLGGAPSAGVCVYLCRRILREAPQAA